MKRHNSDNSDSLNPKKSNISEDYITSKLSIPNNGVCTAKQLLERQMLQNKISNNSVHLHDSSFSKQNSSSIIIEPSSTTTSMTEPDSITAIEKKANHVFPFKKYKIESVEESSNSIILKVIDQDNAKISLSIQGHYRTINYTVGEYLNIIITDPTEPHIISENKNYLVYKPDIIVPSTTLLNNFSCLKSSILRCFYATEEASNLPLLMGSIIHSVMEQCFLRDDLTTEIIEEIINNVLIENSLNINLLQRTINDIKEKIKPHFEFMKEWLQQHYFKQNDVNAEFKIQKVIQTEADFISRAFAIRGRIDAVISVEKDEELKIMPLEIKTGRKLGIHNTQGCIYTILLSEYFNKNLETYILMNTKDKETVVLNRKNKQIAFIVEFRNKLVQYISNNNQFKNCYELPCGDFCTTKDLCSTFTYIMKQPTKSEDYIFFNYWSDIINSDSETNFHISSLIGDNNETPTSISLYLENSHIARNENKMIANYVATYNFQNNEKTKFKLNDLVNIFEHTNNLKVTIGKVTNLTPNTITIQIDNHVNIFEVGQYLKLHKLKFTKGKSWRSNLISLYYEDNDYLKDVLFSELENSFTDDDIKIEDKIEDLNESQNEAIKYISKCDLCCQINGIRGSGKTYLLLILAQKLVQAGKRVLIASPYYKSVEEIVDELIRKGFNPTILASKSTIDARFLPYMPNQKNNFQNDTKIVVTTTSNASDQFILSKRKFDFVLVDDCSLLTIYELLGVIFRAKKFVMFNNYPFKIKGNKNVSFSKMIDKIQDKKINLNQQYFTNHEITQTLFKLSKSTRNIPTNNFSSLEKSKIIPFEFPKQFSWLKKLNDSNACWVDTNLIRGDYNMQIIRFIISIFINNGVSESDIQILTTNQQEQNRNFFGSISAQSVFGKPEPSKFCFINFTWGASHLIQNVYPKEKLIIVANSRALTHEIEQFENAFGNRERYIEVSESTIFEIREFEKE
ncbi:Putative uncharacterized protein DNA2 [Candida maltosa Xu316]|uniref:DNA replication factor Dna2 N-terminal domain-containing protein n=1 Tax=Candida maltosa (strain Xu316) TaxID=1245528 RepID=M3JUD5_CANMX|nr:Putative uncharacterized protein DNA2 [Candida maltosa Xu316]